MNCLAGALNGWRIGVLDDKKDDVDAHDDIERLIVGKNCEEGRSDMKQCYSVVAKKAGRGKCVEMNRWVEGEIVATHNQPTEQSLLPQCES